MKAILGAALLAAGFATGASASPISVSFFSGSQLTDPASSFYSAFNGGLSGLSSGFVIEDFENNATLSGQFEDGEEINGSTNDGEIASSINTSVGSFTTRGGTGSGTTCTRFDRGGNGCDNIALQQSPGVNGQGNIFPFDGEWALNTADTSGLIWNVALAGGQLFESVIFALRDPADAGQRMLSIMADGQTFSTGRLDNETLTLVQIIFGSPRSSATIEIATSTNDAFTFDGAVVGLAPVPLPAAGWMLLAGMGGLVLMRRRAKAAATA
ncbi:MAG: VPLPA-CTERM sorting domain-containing protein [Roseicyclus sp.]